MTLGLAKRILGSCRASSTIRVALLPARSTFVTAHDGFTLEDLVSFTVKRNLANGEDNRDGHSDNHSDNLGVEGPTDDPVILAARALRKRNLLATLMLSQGMPMLLAGDEIGHTQGGNNNAYAQDNEVTWLELGARRHRACCVCGAAGRLARGASGAAPAPVPARRPSVAPMASPM